GALGAALDYLHRNHLALPADVIRLRRARVGEAMHLDAPTVANLELAEALGGGGRGLLQLIDFTRTPMGARRLRGWLLAPLVDVAEIDERLVAVEALCADDETRAALGAELRRVRDLERLTTRTVQRRATPRDLGAFRDSLPALGRVRALLADAPAARLGADRDRIEVEAG